MPLSPVTNISQLVNSTSGRSLSLPQGVTVPAAIEDALRAGHKRNPSNNRESMQRRRHWWLPYVVLEYDKNEIMIDALGGEMTSPNWLSQADLYVYHVPNPSIRSISNYIPVVFFSDVSRHSDISLSAYLRTQPSVPGQSQPDMGNDILLGRLDLSPVLDAHGVSFRRFFTVSPILS